MNGTRMRYFEYKKYGIKLKIYKFLAAVIFIGAIYLYLLLLQRGFSSEQILRMIYVLCTAAIIICVGIKLGSKEIKRRKYLNSPLGVIDRLSGKEFECYLKAHFEKLGYRVKLTKDSGDFGADLVCRKDSEITIIQAKRYNKKVGIAAIQEISAARAYYKADKCMVVTNSFYTKAAVELAKSNNVELWDRNNINTLFVIKEKN